MNIDLSTLRKKEYEPVLDVYRPLSKEWLEEQVKWYREYAYYSNCVICLEDGAIHRADGGPAVMEVSSENRWVVEWVVNGQYHRDDGPCYINEKNGISGWFIDGKHHRDDGPAIVNPNDDGDLYFIHGTKCTKQAQELYYMLKYRKSCNS